MTDADLHAIAAALEAERARWATLLIGRVRKEIGDAYSHARNSVTDTLRATSDGRPTLLKAEASRSLRAAHDHLTGLLVWLSGPSTTSLAGKLRDAREAFYRLAFRLHTPHIPESLRIQPDPEPTQRNIRLIRGAPLHGYELHADLEWVIARQDAQLSAAVALAGSAGATAASGVDLLKSWKMTADRKIEDMILSLLSDSVEHANTEAMADLVHPDFRAEPATA